MWNRARSESVVVDLSISPHAADFCSGIVVGIELTITECIGARNVRRRDEQIAVHVAAVRAKARCACGIYRDCHILYSVTGGGASEWRAAQLIRRRLRERASGY